MMSDERDLGVPHQKQQYSSYPHKIKNSNNKSKTKQLNKQTNKNEILNYLYPCSIDVNVFWY